MVAQIKKLKQTKGRGPKKRYFLGLSPKQRTPPTHPYSLGLFPKIDRSNFHEQKIICLEWSNMPFKHDIVLSLKKV